MELKDLLKRLDPDLVAKVLESGSFIAALEVLDEAGIYYPDTMQAGSVFVNMVKCPYCDSVRVVEARVDGKDMYHCLECDRYFDE